jgi:hypothetical protein
MRSAARRQLRCVTVVVGGGAAGLAAAIAARERGARTLLVERYGFLGGAATNASVLSYCGFYAQGGEPRPMVRGIGGRVLAVLQALGLDVSPVRAPSGNWIVMLDGEAVKYAFDSLVARSGVDCRLHCSLVAAERTGSRIASLTLCDHAGAFDVEAATFVDASGDADLAFAAGAPVDAGLAPARARQAATMPVRIGGVPAHVSVDRTAVAAILANFPNDHPDGSIRADGGHFLRLARSDELWWMAINLVTDGLDSASLSAAERLGRDLAWRFVERLRAQLPGFERAHIVATGPQLGIRDSRQADARYRLTGDDVLSGRRRADGIARGCWPAEVHQGLGGPKFQPIGGEGFYDIPLAAVRAGEVDNLWLGGRVIGCEPRAYGSLRVMGTAFATGQAAGVAAAHVADRGSGDDLERIRADLTAQGALL